MNGGFALVGHGMEGLWKPDDNARQYKSPGFETLLRSHDLRGRQRNLQGHQLRCPGRDELITTSIDGGINFFVTADNYTEGESEKILGQSLKNLHINDSSQSPSVFSGLQPCFRSGFGMPVALLHSAERSRA